MCRVDESYNLKGYTTRCKSIYPQVFGDLWKAIPCALYKRSTPNFVLFMFSDVNAHFSDVEVFFSDVNANFSDVNLEKSD